ncbi:hypothetical protein BJV74DRAFT_880200 [Russula compacta]|nr:hypothetical protein BJV74DRAFT_880200 [Russula compacta]
MSCRSSTCFGAVTNPEDESVPIPTSAKEIKWKHTSDNTASKDDDALEALQSPPKPRCGRPPAEKKALGNSKDPQLAIGNNTLEALQIPPKLKRGQPPAKTKAPDNLEVPSVPIAKSAKVIKRKPTADNTADEGDDASEALQSPLKEKHSRPPVKKKATEVIAPKAGKKPANSDAGMADELEQRRIETLAEMELQEELEEEAEEYSVVRKQLDDEDIKMQPGDGEGKGASVGEPPEDDHETDGEEKVAPKPKQKTKAKFPTGLVPNWQLKLSAPSQTSSKMKPKVSEPEGIALGGLDDDNMFTTFSPLKLKGTGHNCKNESVIILSVSDNSDTVPVKKITTVKPKNAHKSAATLDAKPKSNSNSKSKPHLANLKVPDPKIECVSPAASNSADSCDVNSLPEFA